MDTLREPDASDVRAVFDALLRAEPGFAAGAAAAERRARHLRHRRWTRTALAGAGSGALAVAAVVTVAWPSEGPATVTEDSTDLAAPTAQPPATEPAPLAVVGDEPSTEGGRRILDGLRAASPAGWSFELIDDYGTSIVGHVDDGNGPTYTALWATDEPGTVQLHPCQDPEFVSGAECTETTLADGSVLSRRAMDHYGDRTTIHVALAHPDGSGTGVQSTNVALTSTDPSQDGSNTVVTRDEPPYTLDQLTEVVLAIDEATR